MRKVKCPLCKCLCTVEGKATLYYLPVNKKRRTNGLSLKEVFGKCCLVCGALLPEKIRQKTRDS